MTQFVIVGPDRVERARALVTQGVEGPGHPDDTEVWRSDGPRLRDDLSTSDPPVFTFEARYTLSAWSGALIEKAFEEGTRTWDEWRCARTYRTGPPEEVKTSLAEGRVLYEVSPNEIELPAMHYMLLVVPAEGPPEVYWFVDLEGVSGVSGAKLEVATRDAVLLPVPDGHALRLSPLVPDWVGEPPDAR